MGRSCRTYIVTAPKAGHRNQCLALCEYLGWPVDKLVNLPPDPTSLYERLTRKLHRRRLLSSLREPGLLRIVASGAVSERVVAGFRKMHGSDLFAIYVGTARRHPSIFDVILNSHHALADNPAILQQHNSLLMRGTLARRMPDLSDNATPSAVVLIGGVNKAYDLSPSRISFQLRQMMSSEHWGGSALTIVFSRRTPNELEAVLRRDFAEAKFVGRDDRAGFENAYRTATRFIATPDSITMVCEACSTGRPVSLFDLHCSNPDTSTARFATDFTEAGFVSLGRLEATGSNLVRSEQVRAAEAVRQKSDDWLRQKESANG
jgi:uncharacterized protein